MRSQFKLVVAGQELEVDDLNHIATDTALAEDRVFAELLRIQPYNGSSPYRGILPSGYRRDDSVGTNLQATSIVYSVGGSDATVQIAPFRAVVGPSSASSSLVLRDSLRTAMCLGAGGIGSTLQLAATVSNKRWDLIYVKVDIDVDEAAVSRFVKATNGSETVENVQAYQHTVCTLGVVQGTEGASPTLPALPADTSTAYYIPLAYVALAHPFTLTDPVTPKMIREVAPLVAIATQAGGTDFAPMSRANSLSGFTAGWAPGSDRPREYLPATIAGKVERVIALDFTGGHASIPLGATTVLDDSIDWRKRVFKSSVQIQGSAAAGQLPWNDTLVSEPFCPGCDDVTSTNAVYTVFGQSFKEDFGAIASSSGHALFLHRDFMPAMALNSKIDIYVDSADGYLKARTAATSPNCLMFIWLEASNPFFNANPL